MINFLVLISFFLFSQDKSDKNISLFLFEKQSEFKKDIENKIQNNILDPILGKGRSYVFADVVFDIVTKKQDQSKEGIGVLQQYKEKGAGEEYGDTDFILPGIPKPKSILGDKKRPEAAHGVQKQQTQSIEEFKFSIIPEITRFQVNVIHDDTLSNELLIIAKQRIEEMLLPYKIYGKDPPLVIFKPTKFRKVDIWEDLKKPSVYLPLLYALLFLLLLTYLFGPLWSFLRKYIKAIMAKPAAEVKIEEKPEEGKGKGEGEEEQKQESHQEIDMNFIQKEEEPQPPPEEDESMKKFEPFSYINEENLKRLVYLFLLRKEDPWIIAIVLSYLRPELSKQAFSMLPVELQAKVALEALKVKQATREQIEAIDKDIRENVDFVMGGVEHLMKILEEADAQTKNNVLEYLKNQKPEIYEKIKSILLTFEDLVSFSDKDIQTIIRNTPNEVMAKALKNAPPQIVEKIFNNMSQGARNIINETMEYMGDVTLQQSEEAQAKILEIIKTLEAEGKIASYRRNEAGNIYIIESGDVLSQREKKIEKISAPKDNEDINIYLSQAVEFYNFQNFEQAVEYLNYVIQKDPSNITAWQYLGATYYALADYNSAVNAYEKYVELSGDTEFEKWLNDFKKSLGM